MQTRAGRRPGGGGTEERTVRARLLPRRRAGCWQRSSSPFPPWGGGVLTSPCCQWGASFSPLLPHPPPVIWRLFGVWFCAPPLQFGRCPAGRGKLKVAEAPPPPHPPPASGTVSANQPATGWGRSPVRSRLDLLPRARARGRGGPTSAITTHPSAGRNGADSQGNLAGCSLYCQPPPPPSPLSGLCPPDSNSRERRTKEALLEDGRKLRGGGGGPDRRRRGPHSPANSRFRSSPGGGPVVRRPT